MIWNEVDEYLPDFVRKSYAAGNRQNGCGERDDGKRYKIAECNALEAHFVFEEGVKGNPEQLDEAHEPYERLGITFRREAPYPVREQYGQAVKYVVLNKFHLK